MAFFQRKSNSLSDDLKLICANSAKVPINYIQNLRFKDKLLNDREIALLKEGDMINFEILEQNNMPKTDFSSSDFLLSSKEYVKKHWVNEESGYYAVVGKMTQEQELEALLKIIEFFDKE